MMCVIDSVLKAVSPLGGPETRECFGIIFLEGWTLTLVRCIDLSLPNHVSYALQ